MNRATQAEASHEPRGEPSREPNAEPNREPRPKHPDPSALIMALLAVDPTGLGGVVLDHPDHEFARAFASGVRHLLPGDAPLRRIPIGITADRLIGGIDLAATLARGSLIAERGVLAAADGGVAVFPMAERMPMDVRTVVTRTVEDGVVHVARDGVVALHDARIAAVLLDESVDDETVHASLVDRVAFRTKTGVSSSDDAVDLLTHAKAVRSATREAAQRLPNVHLDERWVRALCETADAFGVASARACILAVRCARAHAALAGRLTVNETDAEAAAALVLGPRATRLPPPLSNAPDTAPDDAPPDDAPPQDAPTQSAPPQDPPTQNTPSDADAERPPGNRGASTPNAAPEGHDDASASIPSPDSDLLRAAVTVALPPGLLAMLQDRLKTGSVSGREGAERVALARGRPRGSRSGVPRGAARLHLLETLRAAAPWQRMRAAAATSAAQSAPTPSAAIPTAARPRVLIRREDFRIRRYIETTGTTVIFVVDASGSSALTRLSEAKGAIELLLAESYARRDRVSLLAFRGAGTETLLPPTRALARAKRVLAAMPGGGGTPLAHAIEAALASALASRRAGTSPLVVFLSDGRANIARDGSPGRAAAERDATLAARAFAASAVPALFVDTSTRGEPIARRVADAMHARYILLPFANAGALGGLVKLSIATGALP